MSKITRYNGNLVAFASEFTGVEKTTFGTETASNDLTAQINANYKRGWGIVDANDTPKLQDFNAIGFTATQLLAYLHQVGVAEWNATQEFYKGSATSHDGRIWLSLVDNPTEEPSDISTEWDKSLTNDDLINAQFVSSNVFTYDIVSDADVIVSDLPPSCPLIVITDSGGLLTTTRTITFPNVRLAPLITVFNEAGQSIIIKGHGDTGAGAIIGHDKPNDTMCLIANYGNLSGQPMLLASLNFAQFLSGVNSLDGAGKGVARTALDVYSKAESDVNNSKLSGVRTSTSTATTLVAGDAGGLVRLGDSGGTGSTVVIPLDATLNLPVLTQISFIDEDTDGRRTFAGETGAVTLTVEGGLTLVSGNLNAPFTAIKLAANHWYISGGLASL